MTEQEVLQNQVSAYANRLNEARVARNEEQDYLKNNYKQAVRSTKRDRNDAYRNAYAQRRQTNKYLGQSLAQMGVRGGMSETARMNAYNNEQNARNSAYSDYLNNKASLYNSYQQNMMNSNNNWNNTIYGLEDNQMNAQLTLAQYLANQGGGSGGSSGGGGGSTPASSTYNGSNVTGNGSFSGNFYQQQKARNQAKSINERGITNQGGNAYAWRNTNGMVTSKKLGQTPTNTKDAMNQALKR